MVLFRPLEQVAHQVIDDGAQVSGTDFGVGAPPTGLVHCNLDVQWQSTPLTGALEDL